MSACSLVRWITSSGKGRSCPSPPGAAFPSMRWLKNTRHYQWNMKIIFSFLHFFSFKSTFINRRSSQATPCTWCWPPPSSTSLFLFLLSFSSTPGGTSFQNTFPLHFLHDGLKDLQITNHSSSYSTLHSLFPSSHFSGSDWLCSETKCKDVPSPAPEEGSAKRRGDLLGQCHPSVGCELWRSMSKGDVALFGNVTLNVEMIAYKDAMIESVRASLFLECKISFALSDFCTLSVFLIFP